MDHLELAQRYNAFRLAQVEAVLTYEQVQVMSLLPLLFHVNDPHLPGYIDTTIPFGFHDFNDQQAALSCQFFGLHMPILTSNKMVDLLGLYTMGSVGSMGFHAQQSDVDVWVVVADHVAPSSITKLQQKCERIIEFAHRYQFPLHCYVIQPRQFIQHRLGKMDLDHSGSAERWLLLDEFYRTHLRLAGGWVLWWLDENHCEAYDSPTVLTMGHIDCLSAYEYFTAALWQLYKGIDAPHKALLKILLLESYVVDYPTPPFLSRDLWQSLQQQPWSASLDPYWQLLQRLTQYLTHRNQPERLHMVRCCFYLKSGVRLTTVAPTSDWRVSTLQDLVQAWGWDDVTLSWLDSCESWDITQVQQFNQALYRLLMSSYYELLQFSSQYDLNQNVRFDELNLITRKLHTMYSQEVSRIHRLHPLWVIDLATPTLYFYQNEDGQVGVSVPTPHAVEPIELVTLQTTVAAVFWACLNGLVTANIGWHLPEHRQQVCLPQLIDFFQKGAPLVINAGLDALKYPWYYHRVLCIVNFERDPTQQLTMQDGLLNFWSSNFLSYGRQFHNLIGSIDLCMQNSWGEWHHFHYAGVTALLDASVQLMQGAVSERELDLQVLCLSKYKQRSITTFVLFSFIQSLSLHQQTRQRHLMSVQRFLIGNQPYAMFFERKQVTYQNMNDTKGLLKRLSHGRIERLLMVDNANTSKHQQMLNVVDDFSVLGLIQYFIYQNWQDQAQGLVFIVDAANQIIEYEIALVDLDELIRQINEVFVFEPPSMDSLFDLPQFYRIEAQAGTFEIYPF